MKITTKIIALSLTSLLFSLATASNRPLLDQDMCKDCIEIPKHSNNKQPFDQNLCKDCIEMPHFIASENAFSFHPFVIEKEQVLKLLQASNISHQELLQSLVSVAKAYSKSEISNYSVGASILGESGAIYLGTNLEFPGFPLSQAVHAEQFAISLARSFGETGIAAIALTAAPCGHCRQFMQEINNDQIKIYTENFEPQTLSDLLPKAFGPQDLGLDVSLMSFSNRNYVTTMDYSPRTMAMIGCYRSYAPYSKAYAGIALQTEDGKIYTGSYLENAAFNPSLPPLQAALVSLVADGKSYDQITFAFLMEESSGLISHEHTSCMLLEKIAPQAEFQAEKIKFPCPIPKN